MKITINEMTKIITDNPKSHYSDITPSPITIKNHIGNVSFILNRVFNIEKNNVKFNTTLFNKVKPVKDYIDNRYDNILSKKKVVGSILFVLRSLGLDKKKRKKDGVYPLTTTFEKYIQLSRSFKPLVLKHNDEVKNNKKLKRFISDEDINSTLDKYESDASNAVGVKKINALQNVLIIKLYTQQHIIRADYVDTKVIFDNIEDEIKDKKYNYADMENRIFYIYNFKTKRYNKLIEFKFNNDIYELIKNITDLRNVYNIDTTFLLQDKNNKIMKASYLSVKVKRLLGVSINDLRHLHATKKVSKQDVACIRRIEKIAKDMGTSTKMLIDVYTGELDL